jgi:2,4-dichlorophenol 6-monooxygenase
MTDFETDVLVVGTGQTGAAATLALATYGARVHAISLWNWLANTPRAHITNQCAVEVLRDLAVEEEARKYATPWKQMSEMLFCTSFTGEEIARIKAWGTGDDRVGDYIAGSLCPLLDIPQPYMEPPLVKNAAERGASFAFNTEYLPHTQGRQRRHRAAARPPVPTATSPGGKEVRCGTTATPCPNSTRHSAPSSAYGPDRPYRRENQP